MMVTVTKITPAFTDARGSITDILDGHVASTGIITFTKGAVRGNHYHKRQTQYTYMLSGAVELSVRDSRIENGPVENVTLNTGDLASIPTHIVHAYRALEDASMLCLTDLSRVAGGYEEDTYRVTPPLIS